MGWKWWSKENNEKNNEKNHLEDQAQPTYQTQTYFRSYSSSRACKPDPEDQNYLICKEKINDGNQTYEKEERVPVTKQASPIFGTNSTFEHQPQTNHLFRHFGSNILHQLDDFDKAMNEFFAPFSHLTFMFGRPQFANFDKNYAPFGMGSPGGARQPQGGSPQGRKAGQGGSTQGGRGDQKYYFSHSDQKNYDIKDI